MFARCAYCGLALLFIPIYGYMNAIKGKNYDKLDKDIREFRDNLFLWHLFSFIVFCVVFGLKTKLRIKRKTEEKPIYQNIRWLKFGVFGLALCAIVEYSACLLMSTYFLIADLVLIVSNYFAMIIFGFFVIENSYLCKFPRQCVWAYLVAITVAIFVGYSQVFYTGLLEKQYHTFYIYCIGYLLIDSYILITNPSEVHFFANLVGKIILCKLKNGEEYTGRLEYVNIRDWKLTMTHVEKQSEGTTTRDVLVFLTDEILSVEDIKVDVESYCYAFKIAAFKPTSGSFWPHYLLFPEKPQIITPLRIFPL